ncbi:hypothetical protein DPMN_044494 [Dreissena polymorpha]|uniref:THAP-type domain-containing protein n=1 Tax=Dreissena polymorpha TaxID=45954 RepID=A0A9D4D2D8_DREPO|nr:hypothetical protein DPMN_044494 [Dreissena polymorpha]
MVNTCSAVGCTNRAKKGGNIKFHRFPTETNRRKKWIQAMKRMKLDDPSQLWEP